MEQRLIDVIPLEDDRKLIFDFYPYEPGNCRGANWRLVDGDDHIRFLDKFESGFVAAALKASVTSISATSLDTQMEQATA